MVKSSYAPHSGYQILGEVLQQQVLSRRKLAVADRLLSAYMWAKNVADQYPDPINGDIPSNMFHMEHARGLVKNLNV